MSDPVAISGSIVSVSLDTKTDHGYDHTRCGITRMTMTFTIDVDPACFDDPSTVQSMRERVNVGSRIDFII